MDSRELAQWKNHKSKPQSPLDKGRSSSSRTQGARSNQRNVTSPRSNGSGKQNGAPPVWPSNKPRPQPTKKPTSQNSKKSLKPNLFNKYEVDDDDYSSESDGASKRRDSMETSAGQGFFESLGDTERLILEGQAAVVSVAVATYPYVAANDRTFSFVIGDVIKVVQPHNSGWWTGELRGCVRMFPVSRTELKDMPLSEYKEAALKSMITPMFHEVNEADLPALPPMRRLTISGEEGGLAAQNASKLERMLGMTEQQAQLLSPGRKSNKLESHLGMTEEQAQLVSPRQRRQRSQSEAVRHTKRGTSPRKERSHSIAQAFRKLTSPRGPSAHGVGSRTLSPKRDPIGAKKKRETIKKHSQSTNALPNKPAAKQNNPKLRASAGNAHHQRVESPRSRLVETSSVSAASPAATVASHPAAEEELDDEPNEDNLVY